MGLSSWSDEEPEVTLLTFTLHQRRGAKHSFQTFCQSERFVAHPQLNRQCDQVTSSLQGGRAGGQGSDGVTHNFHQGGQKFANVGQKVQTKRSHCARDAAPIITRHDHLVYLPSAAEQVVYCELTRARLHSNCCRLRWNRG